MGLTATGFAFAVDTGGAIGGFTLGVAELNGTLFACIDGGGITGCCGILTGAG
jgi:hypothetical protein